MQPNRAREDVHHTARRRRSPRARVLGALIAASLGAATTTARAQGGATGASSDGGARALFERAMALSQQARWAEAVELLERARALSPVAPVLFNLGVAHRALGHARAAIEALQAYVTASGPRGDAARTAEAQRYVTELQAAVAHLTIAVTPATATVTVDGEPVGAARTVDADPGAHVVVATAERYVTAQRTVRLERGASESLTLELAAVAGGAGPTPLARRGPSLVGPIVVLGVGTLGLGLGAVFAAVRGDAFAAYERANCDPVNAAGVIHCQPLPAAGDRDYDRGSQMTVLADVALIVGGAAVAAGAVWLVVSASARPADAPPRAALLVSPTAGGATLGVAGAF